MVSLGKAGLGEMVTPNKLGGSLWIGVGVKVAVLVGVRVGVGVTGQ